MYEKILLVAVLVTFICVQLTTSLLCYDCSTVLHCQRPVIVTCSQMEADRLRMRLKQWGEVPSVTSNNFECVITNYTENGSSVMQIRGCMNSEIDVCSSETPAGVTWKRTCKQCDVSLCNEIDDDQNTDDPAAAVSASAFTLLAAFAVVVTTNVWRR